MVNFSEIEAKWNSAWEGAKIFEPEVGSDKPPFMVFAAFPYVNAPQHIGHLRTYGTADLLARYNRMRGFSVLFPMAFHATGTPVLAFAKRIKAQDSELIEELKAFHIPDEDIAKMTDPVYIADYFIKELEKGMHAAGYSIDWRRKFVSTDERFSKFVEWQFGILQGLGYLTQGSHPVGWCTNENNAVGMHDTKHDVEPEIEEQTAIKFKVDEEDASVLCSTYRPETLFAVTNIFVNEDAKYVLCRVEGQIRPVYFSKASAEILKHQMKLEVLKEIDGREMLKKRCINPINNETVPVLPGFFVKEKVGTGIVMSVPSHAPFDYAALERLRVKGYDLSGIKPRKIIDVKIGKSLGDAPEGNARPELLDVPALAYLEVLHAGPDSIEDMLESATKLEYKEESHWGKMLVPGYEGMSEPEARDRVKAELIKNGNATVIYEMANAPVYCRCGTEVVVKLVEGQWFINYGDAKWKKQVREALKKIRVFPEKSMRAFEAAADWINLRAVARSQGLGTRLPLDRNFIIESLSDSTIYPAFYTIANLIAEVKTDSLTPEFFDHVFLGTGDAEAVSKSTGVDYDILRRCKESFEYWYSQTSSHSAYDLIFNHYTMYIFNHIAIFDKKYWPKQIVVNGMVLYDGAKMSKSLGNIVPLAEGIKQFGGDILRILEVGGTDLFTDSNFSTDASEGVKERLQYIYDTTLKARDLESGELGRIDYWLYSKLNRKIMSVTEAMDKLELRDAVVEMLYNSVLELRRYFTRKGSNGTAVKDYLSSITLMLQPIAPHMAEEFWHMLGNGTFVSLERWPAPNSEMISEDIETGEELVDRLIEDAKQVVALMSRKSGKKAAKTTIVVADEWKRTFTNMLAKKKNVSKVLEKIKSDSAVNADAAAKYAGSLAKKVNELQEVKITQQEEYDSFDQARDYIAEQLGCEVVVEKEAHSKSKRAWKAMPMKPSLDILFN